jgi:hypothetical protein
MEIYMRKNFTLALLALFAYATTAVVSANAADSSPSTEMMVQKSKAVWEAYKTRDVASIKNLSAPEYIAYTQGGPSNLQKDIETIQKLTIESYSLDEPKTTVVTKDVVILHYKCNVKGSFENLQFKPVYVTETWVNRGGKWLIIAYTETAI